MKRYHFIARQHDLCGKRSFPVYLPHEIPTPEEMEICDQFNVSHLWGPFPSKACAQWIIDNEDNFPPFSGLRGAITAYKQRSRE